MKDLLWPVYLTPIQIGNFAIFIHEFWSFSKIPIIQRMRVTSLASLALSGVSAYKNMKQKMIEDRLAFDKEILLAGYFEDDYDTEWEPWDLEDEELQVSLFYVVGGFGLKLIFRLEWENLQPEWTMIAMDSLIDMN